MPPLSLYIHLPWCVRKCPYCDFNSHRADTMDETAYLQALLSDLDAESHFAQGRPLHSIFIGGGTPSLFSAGSIEQLLARCAVQFDFADDIEITLEANPGTFEQQKFAAFRHAGVNRLSIGIQSFNADHLRALGRIHDADEAHRAVMVAQQAGFGNINLDLMFALPGQSIEQALADVATACNKDVQHISHYQLTIEPNTLFHKHPPQQPDSEQMWQMQTACQQLLHEHGYRQYEVSAWAQKSQHSRHNLNYWRFGDYIGVGAGAHGKLSTDNGIVRRWKKRQPADYMHAASHGEALSGSRVIESKELIFEFLLNTLRLRKGVSSHIFREHTALPFEKLQQACTNIDPALLQLKPQICTTDYGYRFIDEILQRLL